jgi:hypothetical protein
MRELEAQQPAKSVVANRVANDVRPTPVAIGEANRRASMRRIVMLTTSGVFALVLWAAPAHAQAGHFVTGGGNAPECTDIGTQVSCDVKVAGLGGTVFEITVEAAGIASVECTNPGGNVAPGQDTELTVAGSSGEIPTPRSGNFTFRDLTTEAPTVPNVPTCPNPQWSAAVVDVEFTSPATLTLFEDGQVSDQIEVAIT